MLKIEQFFFLIKKKRSPVSKYLVSPVAQMVKNLPAVKDTQALSLGWEDLLEEWIASHSSILVWRIPWTEEPGGLQSVGSQRVGHDSVTDIQHTHIQVLREVLQNLHYGWEFLTTWDKMPGSVLW